MDVEPKVIVVLCLNRTDGLMEHSRVDVIPKNVNLVYVWDMHGAKKVVMNKDVLVHRTAAFRRNPQNNEIEQELAGKSAYNRESIIFIGADGVLYPCFSMGLRIAGGGDEFWHIEATLALVFGFTVEITAAAVTIEQGRKDCTFTRCSVLEVLE